MAIVSWPFPNEKAISFSFIGMSLSASTQAPPISTKKKEKYCPDRMSRKRRYLVSSPPPNERLKKLYMKLSQSQKRL